MSTSSENGATTTTANDMKMRVSETQRAHRKIPAEPVELKLGIGHLHGAGGLRVETNEHQPSCTDHLHEWPRTGVAEREFVPREKGSFTNKDLFPYKEKMERVAFKHVS